MSSLREILGKSALRDAVIRVLKKSSFYYPEIYKVKNGEETYYSTLVRIERDGVWYVVHHVESCIEGHEMCLLRLISNVYNTQLLYVVGAATKINGDSLESIDKLQQSEASRLKNES